MPIPDLLLRLFRKQGYQVVGRHSAVKTCYWTKKSLRSGGSEYCYKQKFFGVQSLRCLQMTPTLGRCLQRCLFCWRVMPSDVGITDWDQTRLPKGELDEPSLIVEESLKAHRRALIGYKGDPNVDKSLLELALNPVHVAISLEGEVTLYPKIGDLIREYFRSGFKTVFLVTNGLSPKAIDELTCEPSQLYVSVCAPNKKVYHEVCRPLVKDGWKRLNETLELLETLSCPTVMRITLVRHLNLKDVNGYARIARKANSTYLEPKAAMSIGFFLKRIPKEYMPTHGEVKSFAQRLSELTGYNIIDEAPPSRVVLLSKLIKPVKLVN